MSNKRGLVLSGGGAKGSGEFGAISAMRRLGISWDYVFGVSVGALNGAMVSMNDYYLMNLVWFRMVESREDIFTGSLKNPLLWLKLAFGRKHLFDFSPLHELVNKYVNVDALKIPLEVGVTNFTTGEYMSFSSEKHKKLIKKGIIASATMPVLWQPVKLFKKSDNEFYDGGVRNVTPIGRAIDKGCDVIDVVLLNNMDKPLSQHKSNNILDVFKRLLEIRGNEVFRNDLDQARRINRQLEDDTLDSEKYKIIEINIIQPPADEPLGDSLEFTIPKAHERYSIMYNETMRIFNEKRKNA